MTEKAKSIQESVAGPKIRKILYEWFKERDRVLDNYPRLADLLESEDVEVRLRACALWDAPFDMTLEEIKKNPPCFSSIAFQAIRNEQNRETLGFVLGLTE